MNLPEPTSAVQTPLEQMGPALRAQIARLEGGADAWRIPALSRRYQPAAGMHYHFCPELFILTGGECDFQFAAQSLTVRAGEVCLVPGGIAHSERVRRTDSDYRSIIVNFYNKTVYVHGAHDNGHGLPAPDNMYFFTTPLYADIITFLDRVGELAHEDEAANRVPIRALLTATLALVAQLVEAPQDQPSPVRDIVTRCQWLVKRHANNCELSLGFLAKELELSPSYLSRVFSDKTGERLAEYITRIRIQNAADGLRTTQLSVKAIGAACGFSDTSYFCRVFRQLIGQTPQDYRARYYRASLEVERRPKTVLAEGAHFVGGGVYAPLALSELNVFDALRCTRLSIKSIATGLGFVDEASFAKFFQAATGQTPAQYRADSQVG
jgi:AraC-like DNA-binding protein/quercetin dioxygenase-like cupin family protein